MAKRNSNGGRGGTRTPAKPGEGRERQGYSVGTDGPGRRAGKGARPGAVSARTAPDRRVLIGAVALLALLVAGVLAYLFARDDDPATPTSAPTAASLPGLQTGVADEGYWPAETDQLEARLKAMGLPALANEGTVLHTHQHLDVFVDGRRLTVPQNIGIAGDQSFIAPLHTHDTRGVIHVESDTVRDFTLGQFMNVWGVRLANRCVGGYCASGDKRLHAYVNGREVTGDPAAIKLEPHQQIVLSYGTDAMVQKNIPRSFPFAEGE